MAEAHSAVAFSFSITHRGVNINYNREVGIFRGEIPSQGQLAKSNGCMDEDLPPPPGQLRSDLLTVNPAIERYLICRV